MINLLGKDMLRRKIWKLLEIINCAMVAKLVN